IHAAIQLKNAAASVLVPEKKDEIAGYAEIYINRKTSVVNDIGVVLFIDTVDIVNAPLYVGE
ncbi:hypothetical protein C8A03DRAFT_19915, partial [Achaetomium macrosporum]